ncbi:MAG: dihydrofolate reductase [Steroidobacteraceae bacterium]
MAAHPARPLISLLVAMAENGVIGRDNGMPWHLPDDLKRFKSLTIGKPMLMGRKTFDSIGKPLPGRTSLVLTRSRDWSAPGAVVVHSLDEAVERAGQLPVERAGGGPVSQVDGLPELVCVGGAEVYRLALPRARRIYLTRVLGSMEGDTVFPPLDERAWRETRREPHPADARHAYPMVFCVLERVERGDPSKGS